MPVALLAAFFHREWSVLGELIFSIVLTFGTRAFGIWMATNADRAVREAEEAALLEN